MIRCWLSPICLKLAIVLALGRGIATVMNYFPPGDEYPDHIYIYIIHVRVKRMGYR
jgi:hypothetical protein